MKSEFFMDKKIVKWINNLILICKHTISKFKYEKIGNIKILLERQEGQSMT